MYSCRWYPNGRLCSFDHLTQWLAADSWFDLDLQSSSIIRPGNILSWTWKSLKIARHVVLSCELFWFSQRLVVLLPSSGVASPNDLNLGTLVTSEPRLNPGFTSWGDFVGSTVGRVQQTVIHSDPLGSDPANGYHNIYIYITHVFFFKGAFPLQLFPFMLSDRGFIPMQDITALQQVLQ